VTVNHADQILRIWGEHVEVARALSAMATDVSRAVDIIVRSLQSGGQLLVAGNGGSAADAQHIVAELTGRFRLERPPLRALALHANTSAVTAIANDYGYDRVFERELSAHACPDDVFMGLSTSGASPNILRAIEAARERQVKVIGLTGESGGQMRRVCDVLLCVPSKNTARIQEMHITIGHTICELVERSLFE
jgi:D-sedoheptulose 7-phosphate isomerase